MGVKECYYGHRSGYGGHDESLGIVQQLDGFLHLLLKLVVVEAVDGHTVDVGIDGAEGDASRGHRHVRAPLTDKLWICQDEFLISYTRCVLKIHTVCTFRTHGVYFSVLTVYTQKEKLCQWLTQLFSRGVLLHKDLCFLLHSYALLLDAGSLARELAQVVQLGATHLAVLVHLNAVDVGRLDGEDTLYANGT